MRKLLCIIVMFVPALCFGRIPFITSRTTYSWSSTYLYDSFTDADNSTSLSSGTHIPDIRPVGATYSVTTTGSMWGISSSQAYMSSGASEYRCVIDGGHTDGVLSSDITLSSATNRSVRGLIFKYTSGTDFLKVLIVKVSGVNHIEFRNASTSLQLFNYSFVDGQTYNLKVDFATAGTVKVFINNVLQFTNTNADISTHIGTKVGMVVSSNGTTNDDLQGRWDNLTFGDGSNTSPIANAGSDASISLPTSSVMLNGSGSDPDGSISNYAWSQVSGPNSASISSSSTASTSVSGLTQGTYIFRLTVTDNNGATATDDVTVTVNASTNSSNEWLTIGNSNTDPATQFIGTTDNQPLIFKTHGIERFRITNDGKLGFNTTTDIPSDAVLAVNGNIYARKLKVTPATWPDYVFHNNYRLRSLTEVESFLQKYHHLPDVPSARTVQHQGVDIGNSQSMLLQKIEELTLYIIEQNKKIEKLEMQNKQFAAMKEELEDIKNQLKHK